MEPTKNLKNNQSSRKPADSGVHSKKWVTVLTVATETEAKLKKNFLEDAGIECSINGVGFRVPSTVGRFKINVPVGKEKEAQEILNELK